MYNSLAGLPHCANVNNDKIAKTKAEKNKYSNSTQVSKKTCAKSHQTMTSSSLIILSFDTFYVNFLTILHYKYHKVCALTPLADDMFWHCTFCTGVNTM